MVDSEPSSLTDSFFILFTSPQTISWLSLLYTHLELVEPTGTKCSTVGLVEISSALYIHLL